MTTSASAASGESSSLTRATTKAPPRRARPATAASRSGLRPDCEIARQSSALHVRRGVVDRADRRRRRGGHARPAASRSDSGRRWRRGRNCRAPQVTTARGGAARRRSASARTTGALRRSCARTTAGRLGRLAEHPGRSRRSASSDRGMVDTRPSLQTLKRKGVEFGDEVVGVAAIVGLGELHGPAVLQKAAPLDQQARRAPRPRRSSSACSPVNSTARSRCRRAPGGGRGAPAPRRATPPPPR